VAAFSRTSVVLVDFPFSDLSDTKLRPAIVLAEAGRGDLILCQITSNSFADAKAFEITNFDFAQGSLRQTSFVRPNKIFTGHETLINRRIGILKEEFLQKIIDSVTDILNGK
jgi:mRNA interferase MazF